MFRCVSKGIPNHEELTINLTLIANNLEAQKQRKFAKVLDELGLAQDDMGVIVQKESANEQN